MITIERFHIPIRILTSLPKNLKKHTNWVLCYFDTPVEQHHIRKIISSTFSILSLVSEYLIIVWAEPRLFSGTTPEKHGTRLGPELNRKKQLGYFACGYDSLKVTILNNVEEHLITYV